MPNKRDDVNAQVMSAEEYKKQYVWPKSTYLRRYDKSRQTESLDLEEPDGYALRRYHKQHQRFAELKKTLFEFSLTITIGMCVGMIYIFLTIVSDTWIAQRITILKGMLKRNEIGNQLLFAMGTCTAIALAGALCVFYEPCAGGGGMPEVIAYLNGAKMKKYHTWRTLIFKIIGCLAIVSSGLFSGFDGPLTHIGCIFGVLATKVARGIVDKMSASTTDPEVQGVKHVLHKRNNMYYAVIGAAAGMTASGRAPLSGVLFAIEEAISFYDETIIFRTLFSSVVTYLVTGAAMHYYENRTLWTVESFSLYPKDAECILPVDYEDIPVFMLLGVLGGILGQAFNEIVIQVYKIRYKFTNRRPFVRLAEIVAICVLTMSVTIMVPHAFDSCVPNIHHFDHMKPIAEKCLATCEMNEIEFLATRPECTQLVCLPPNLMRNFQTQIGTAFQTASQRCPTNVNFTASIVNVPTLSEEFSPPERFVNEDERKCIYPLRSLFWKDPDSVIRNLFTRGTFSLFSYRDLAIFGILYLSVGILTYDVMLPTDLVVPSMIFGGVMGRMYGMGINLFKGRLGHHPIDPGAMAVLGTVSFWSGSSRLLLAVALMFLEATQDLSLLPGIIITVLVSMVVGEALGDTQFHTEIHLRGLALLPDAAPEFIKTMVVEDAMTKDVIVLRQREKKETIRKLLECTTHHGYPVVRMDYLSLQDRGKMFDANEEMRRVEEAERAKEKNKDATDSDGSSTIVDEQDSFTRDADTMTLDTLASYQISLSDGRKSESVQTVSPKRRLAGVITRKQLKRLAGLDPNEEIRIEGDFEDFMRTHEKNTRLESKDEADLKEYFMAETDPQAVDLVPLMNHPPYIVKRDMSLHKAYAIFRKLGLRHLCVVNDEYDVIGLLTRKNFDKVINHGGH